MWYPHGSEHTRRGIDDTRRPNALPFSSYSWSYSAAPNMRPKIGEAKSASLRPVGSLHAVWLVLVQFILPPTTAVIAPSREALRLYREIPRTAKGFWWEDDYGQPFGEQLAKSARREFEDWRGERDPEVANRIMVRSFRLSWSHTIRCSATARAAVPQITRHCLMDIQNQVRCDPSCSRPAGAHC